jgi:thiol-disulfide isomerase/thioredoxin
LELTRDASRVRYDFELELLDGERERVRLGDFLGSAIWLNFFATWCGPCNAEADRLVQIAEHYKPYGLVTISVDVKESPEAVRAYRERHHISYPIALDRDGSIFKGFGLRGYPTQLFFGRDGRITCFDLGDMEFNEMDNEIAVALGGNSIPMPSPAPDFSPSPPAVASPEPTG